MIQPACQHIDKIEDTGFGYTLSLIGGKYKILTIYWLYKNPPAMRFNELKRCLNGISFKTLSTTLKEMERDGLVIRKEYPQIPPKVEYSLSKRGLSLLPLLDLMCQWGEQHQKEE